MRDLRFRFADGGRELFHGLSLTIRKGERIGIRGASGAGKTTLFNLLLGLYEPTGVKSSSTARRLRRPTAGHGRTASGTSRRASSSPTAASRPTSRWASPPGRSTGSGSCRRSARHSSGSWSPGWRKGSTPTSGSAAAASRADSASASGIARALYRQADVLFFDEATSALDSRTEEEINRSIAGLAARDAGLTLVVIAHRESSLEYCNRIITIGE